MVTTNDGGVFYTADLTESEPSFTEINKGYNTLQFYTCAIGPDPGDNHCLGGTQDDGTLYYSGSPLSMNDMVAGGDGSFCCFDQVFNRPLIASAFYNSYFFFPDGEITPFPDFKWTGIFVNPADYDYLNSTLFANAVTYDQMYPGSIVMITGIPDHPAGQIVDLKTWNTVPFSFLKVSPFSLTASTTLYLGTQSGKLYRATNLQTYPAVTDIGSLQFPSANISSIDIGQSEQELLVIFSNFGVPSVWLSLDGGDNWMNKEGNLPDIPIRYGIFHPDNRHQVILATELGVWVTEDIQAPAVSWSQCAGFPNVRTDMISFRSMDNNVLAATHGRGLFLSAYPSSIREIPETGTTLTIYPNPADHVVRIHCGWKQKEEITIRIYAQDGHLESVQTVAADMETQDPAVDISSLPAGMYILAAENGKSFKSGKLIKTPAR